MTEALDPQRLADFQRSVRHKSRVPEDDLPDAEALAFHLHRVMYCSVCKGKGSIWNPSGKDFECDCRTDARIRLVRYQRGQKS